MFSFQKKKTCYVCAEMLTWISSFSSIASRTCIAPLMDYIIYMIVNNCETYGAKSELTARITLTGGPPITMIRPVWGEGKISGVTLRGHGGDFPRGVVLSGNPRAG